MHGCMNVHRYHTALKPKLQICLIFLRYEVGLRLFYSDDLILVVLLYGSDTPKFEA
jgi:hypothetical protein